MRAGKDRRRSYLPGTAILHQPDVPAGGLPMSGDGALPFLLATRAQVLVGLHGLAEHRQEIGRASCRERVCQYVLISVVPASLKKTHYKELTRYIQHITK